MKLWDWSKGFSSETNSKVELVLDVDVKKKVRTEPSILATIVMLSLTIHMYS